MDFFIIFFIQLYKIHIIAVKQEKSITRVDANY